MTNKIRYPWEIFDKYGLFNCAKSDKISAKMLMHADDFIAYAEPFEPIKITKDDVGQIEAIANKNSLKPWY